MFLQSQTLDEVPNETTLIENFEEHIRAASFPCVGAKSSLRRNQMAFLVVGDLRCPRDDHAIHDALRDFVTAFRANPEPFQSLVVLFNMPDQLSEEQFERAMWARLQSLSDFDARAGFQYDKRVSSNVNDPRFSLSFAEEAFFVVGLHPGASRAARAFEVPALVFNVHAQFEALRTDGRYEKLRASIIERDVALAGSPNPMLARHGECSEAAQYSGRAVGADWKCPFASKHLEPGANA